MAEEQEPAEDLGAAQWMPIELPTNAELQYSSDATAQLETLLQAWAAQKSQLDQQSPGALREFVTRLVRSWAIETGIIERLYDLDEGITETLIEHGFRADLLSRGDSDMAPGDLLAILNDHLAAADMVRDVVANGRPLNKFFIRELHQLLTRTQTHTEARTVDGAAVHLEMRHGEFKRLPNNPLRADGVLHHYAPPEQVESEMDCLIEGAALLEGESPAVQAAWIHHRFTQIHPFQDGNGRVARSLTNLVFIRAGLFPLVISRKERSSYISTLEAADGGQLGPLVDLFARVESETIIKALSVAIDEVEGARGSTSQAVISRMVAKVGTQIRDRDAVLRGVNDLAIRLRDLGVETVGQLGRQAATQLQQAAPTLAVRVFTEKGGPDVGKEDYWHFQRVSLARELGYWVNFSEAHYWFRVAVEGMPIRLQYVVSLHHIGQVLSGYMQAGAFAEFEAPRLAVEPAESGSIQADRQTKNCTPRVYGMSWQSSYEAEAPRFESWLDESFALSLRYWMDLLT